MAPSALARLMREWEHPFEGIEALRLLVHAGSPCPVRLKEEVMGALDPKVVWEFYGATEGQFTVCSPDEWSARPGTVGRARPGRTLSVDEERRIWCRAPSFARFSYWRDDEKTASAWRDGSFSVGDIGRLDDEGYLFIDGRRDDLIITGGVNVYPVEVENALAEVEGLADVAVFGLPDEEWGQRVCAGVVPAGPGRDARAGERLVARLRGHAAVRLAGYKRPKTYVVLEELPRTATGKVQRGRIPELLEED